jgi:hypothetical protein
MALGRKACRETPKSIDIGPGFALRVAIMQLTPRLERLRRWYVGTAVMLLNCVLVAALFGGVFLLVYQIRRVFDARWGVSPVEKKYGKKIFSAYPNYSRPEARALLGETWSRPVVFEPFTQFKERPFSGRFVNVSAHGFRHSRDQAAWPPDTNAFNVFMFGGSTLFGYGLPDAETVPSFLQAWLRTNGVPRANVYNFGRAYYYSSQEIVLFLRLLAAGHVPHVALFVDGLNDAAFPDDVPEFSKHIRKMMDSRQHAKPAEQHDSGPTTDAAPKVVGRYRNNMQVAKALAAGYGVQPAFTWQPVPVYKYDLRYHAFTQGNFKQHPHARSVYELMDRERQKLTNDRSFIWCGDLQEGAAQAFYVDEVHYNPALSRLLAERIGEALQTRGMLKPNEKD